MAPKAFFLGLVLLALTGCGRVGLRRLLAVPRTQFTATQKLDGVTIRARICTHKEVSRHFTNPQDLYHYYHLLHLRIENQSYVRYTLQTEHCSFFTPPAQVLRSYTKSSKSGYGALLSFFNALLFFPIYVISMAKAAVESPPYLLEPDLVVPRPFGVLSALYGLITLSPLLLGTMAEQSASSKNFAEADRLILTQRRELSVPPYKTCDRLLLTPRAGFVTPCTVGLYNHKTHVIEKASLAVTPVW